jgi:hypothetical protein
MKHTHIIIEWQSEGLNYLPMGLNVCFTPDATFIRLAAGDIFRNPGTELFCEDATQGGG